MIIDQFFTGRLVDDPELRFTSQGQPVTNFRIAESNYRRNDQGGWDTLDRVFLPVELWGPVAEEVSRQLNRGDKIWVRGQLRTREWETKDGSRRSRVEVKAWEIAVVLSARQVTPGSAFSGSPQAAENRELGRQQSKVLEDEPPF